MLPPSPLLKVGREEAKVWRSSDAMLKTDTPDPEMPHPSATRRDLGKGLNLGRKVKKESRGLFGASSVGYRIPGVALG